MRASAFSWDLFRLWIFAIIGGMKTKMTCGGILQATAVAVCGLATLAAAASAEPDALVPVGRNGRSDT